MSEAECRCEVHDGSGCEIPAEDHSPAPAGARGAAAEKVCSAIAEMAERSVTLACAKSLTGRALCSAFVEIPETSAVFRGSVTVYAAGLKASILGADGELLRTKGPVEERVALDMVCGVCRVMGADVALATTGVAGPGPADGHTAGTVWVVCTEKLGEYARLYRLHGGRSGVRAQAVEAAVDLLTELLCMTFR